MPAVPLAGVSNISKAQAAPYPTPDATMAPRPTAHLRTHCKETPAHHTRAAKTDACRPTTPPGTERSLPPTLPAYAVLRRPAPPCGPPRAPCTSQPPPRPGPLGQVSCSAHGARCMHGWPAFAFSTAEMTAPATPVHTAPTVPGAAAVAVASAAARHPHQRRAPDWSRLVCCTSQLLARAPPSRARITAPRCGAPLGLLCPRRSPTAPCHAAAPPPPSFSQPGAAPPSMHSPPDAAMPPHGVPPHKAFLQVCVPAASAARLWRRRQARPPVPPRAQ